MKKTLTILFSFLLLFISSSVNAAEVILSPNLPQTTSTVSTSTEVVFTRSLTVGSSGRDVMALKKLLSLELKTTQDSSATFTTNTATEVKTFQEKYAVEILIPSNLSAGTGYVGPSTIKKLNQLAPTYFIKLSDFVAPVVSSTTSSVKNTFVSTLKLGFIGDEVVLLKSILNADPATALSPKNSTMIYDLATQVAINKFQEKYANEILAPSGLTSSTGVVGPATRKKLNSLLNQTLVSIGVSTSTATTSTQTTPTKQVFTVSGNSGNALSAGDATSQRCEGTTLVITKIGFGSTYDTRTPNSSQCGNFNNDYNYQSDIFYPMYDTSSLFGSSVSSTTKRITSFSIDGPFTTTKINESAKTITIFAPPLLVYKEVDYTKDRNLGNAPSYYQGGQEVPGGYPLLEPALPYDGTRTPKFNFQGSSTVPKTGVVQNFNYPVTYKVTAKDGSTVDYTVSIKRVTCPSYSPRIPIGGIVTEIKEAVLDGDISNNAITNPFGLNPIARTLSDKYTYVTFDYAAEDNTAEQAVINKYCNLPKNASSDSTKTIGMMMKTTSLGFFKTDNRDIKIEKGSYFLGEVEAPVYKVNTCADGLFGGCFEYAREYKSGGFSYK